MSQTLPSAHSTDVKMWLDCGEHGTVELARVSPRSVIAKHPATVPACEAELVIEIDGYPVRKRVETSGFTAGRLAALVTPLDKVAPF